MYLKETPARCGDCGDKVSSDFLRGRNHRHKNITARG
jgi:hypothetical protein